VRRIAMPETIYEEIIGEVKADYDIKSACYALQTLFAFSEEDYDMRVYVECVAQHLYDKYIGLFSDRNARLADYLRGPVTDLIVWDEPDTRCPVCLREMSWGVRLDVIEGGHEMRYGYYHLECIPSSLFKENVNPFGADKELHDLVLRKLINDEKRKKHYRHL
jgi:hypothetical protein